ncbi:MULTISPECIES: hypothetical protein [Burkholderiaceae]|uniref:hypothetical protein n=1 Tax=Burkholderiaceae TaxID=119060 RepID=UPI00096829C6|nr:MULTISPECIES: hypothetical protein [Burkholderiaceae]MCF2133796.1 uroporphyrinogen-III C-methyltransferase [Mycetohabitans sp. B3]MCG1038838.1 uroporphyrinogen-III C-methyltransferase [Mycetohabitans sp. B7]SIT68575.1 hypothetical protein SAMN04487769_1347 [Burkholderia sp. b14]
MAVYADETSKYVFNAQEGHLWMQPVNAALPAIQISLVPENPNVVACTQAPGPTSEAISLCLVVADGGRQKVLHALVRNVQQLVVTKSLRLKAFQNLISSTIPISKVTHTGDGVLVSTADNSLHYAQLNTPRVQPVQLAAATSMTAPGNSNPLSEVIAAKDAIVTFLNNLCDQLPNMAAALEKAASQEVLNALGTEIKAQQQNLSKIFDKPLTSFISQHNQGVQRATADKTINTGSANGATTGSTNARARRLLLQKLDVQRYLNPFSAPSAGAALAPSVVAQVSGDNPDPLEALGKLFEPFNTLLNASNLASLLNMGVTDLLNAVSGSQPFSSVIEDFFNLFKIDEAMNSLHGVFSSGQLSSLIGQLTLKSYLQQPVQNAFFNALYAHYFPGKTFTIADLIAFLGALLGFVAFEVQGKESEFQAVFTDKQSLNEFTNAPATLVALINGTPPTSPIVPQPVAAITMMASEAPVPAALSPSTPPAWRAGVASALSSVVTLLIGVVGVLSFGTGLIASPTVGGVAASISQGLFGMVQNLNTSDVKWDLLSGFAGGFSGAFISTLIGNKLFAGWAQHGATPSARVQKLRLIMMGFVLTLGGGGGGVVSALVKNYAKTGKLNFDDPLALTTGVIGGIGGGAMGCGLQFMGGLSGSMCLPVPLSLAEAQRTALNALAGAQPAQMDNASLLPHPNGAFPVNLPNWSTGIYATQFNDPMAVPSSGLSVAAVTWGEFNGMDNSYLGHRERLFWLEDLSGGPPASARRADLVIGIHGIGRFVFPNLTHMNLLGNVVNFSRPMYKTDFAQFLAGQAYLTNYLNTIRTARTPIVKLMICFSALPLGCCSLGQELATSLNATVYAGRPPVYPWLDGNNMPRVPGLGGWIKYTA